MKFLQRLTDSEIRAELDATKAEIADLKKQVSEQCRCSFCGKRPRDVRKMVAGPGSNICNECVSLCSEICSGRED